MKKIFVILLVVFLNFSCESEESNNVQLTNNFYALMVGNSWSYSYYLKDMATNNFVDTQVKETVDITATIIINNTLYYKFKHTVTGNDGSYNMLPSNGEKTFTLRDSSGYLIDQNGNIKYSNASLEEYVVDQMLGSDLTYNLKLSQEIDNLVTDAGSFSCLDNHYYYRNINGDLTNSLDHIYREDGIGEILSTISYISQNEHFAEKRLESYSLQ